MVDSVSLAPLAAQAPHLETLRAKQATMWCGISYGAKVKPHDELPDAALVEEIGRRNSLWVAMKRRVGMVLTLGRNPLPSAGRRLWKGVKRMVRGNEAARVIAIQNRDIPGIIALMRSVRRASVQVRWHPLSHVITDSV